jgi:hypothetical protein
MRAIAVGYMPSTAPGGASASAPGSSAYSSGQSIGQLGSTPVSTTVMLPPPSRTNCRLCKIREVRRSTSATSWQDGKVT